MINPYAETDWTTAKKVASISHAHARAQTYFNNLVAGGIRHFAISNYYPSEPFTPLSDHFTNIPQDAVGTPNAEHHNFGIGKCHFNGIGCTLVSGNPRGQSPVGMESIGVYTWQGAIDAILETLSYDDAGGLTVNHPTWTGLSTETVLNFLDYDPRVLGIEVFSTYEALTLPVEQTEAVGMWDDILKTGRRCWGFAIPDHMAEKNSHWTGRNILLINGDVNDYTCQKAYRNGNFYFKIYDSNLAFDSVEFSNNVIRASASLAEKMTVVIDGERIEMEGNSLEFRVPEGSIYVRVEASMPYEWVSNRDGFPTINVTERIFSNPIILQNENKKTNAELPIQTIFDL